MRIRILAAICCALTLISCSNSGTHAPVVTGFSVVGGSAAVPKGESTPAFGVKETFSDGSSQTVTASWSSSQSSIAAINAATGVATGMNVGGPVTITGTFTASSGTQTVTAHLTVTSAVVTGYSISGGSTTVAVGESTPAFIVKANYSDSTAQTVTASWSSSNNNIASIDPVSGVATGLFAGGPVTITATIGGQTATAQLTVTAPAVATLQQIIINPTTATQPAGIAQQFTALGIWSDHSTQDITAQVSWDTTDHSLATIGASGLATGLAPAPASGVGVTATMSGVIGSANFVVSSAVLNSINAVPDSAVIPVGANQPFAAEGVYSDGTSADVTTLVNWASDNLPVATVGSKTGLALSIAPGTANIAATYTGATPDSSLLTVVNATLTGVQVSPKQATVGLSGNQQFTVLGTYTDGSQQDLTASATWSSSDTTIAAISTGLATPAGAGTTVITAAFGGFSDTGNLTVTAAQLTKISLVPALPQVGIGSSVQFYATGEYEDGTTQDLTNAVTWTSSDAGVATIGAAGSATTTGAGQATITATLSGISGSTTLKVNSATLQTIFILPASVDPSTLGTPPQQPALDMPLRGTLQLLAVGYYSDQSFQTLAGVSWSETHPEVAMVNGTGLLRSKHKSATTTVTARWNGNTATASVTVSAIQAGTLSITPKNSTVAAGTGLQFTAMVTLSDGVTVVDVTSAVRWTTSNYQLAAVNKAGFASALIVGTPTITATYYNPDGTTNSDSTTLNITASQLQGLAVGPASGTITLGTSQQFKATGTFFDGTNTTTQDLTALTNWSSSDITVAVMVGKIKGLAASAGAGTATITGSYGGQSGTSQLTVVAP